jgi:hypothetical protein
MPASDLSGGAMSGKSGELRLGELVDPATGQRTGEALLQQTHHLTTHGVIVGMTGSGKTGLGVVLLEEALLSGVPVLVLDPKGDMGNLMLTFPDLRPSDFRPWIDPAEARREGVDLEAAARSAAESWRAGLASWGIGPERIRQLRESAGFTVFTPGSGAGVPLNLLGSLAAPAQGEADDLEATRDEIEGIVSGLLAIAGLEVDPLSSPEHILLSSVIEHEWVEGRDLSLGDLIRLVQNPPFRKLGVFALEEFYPAKDRRELAVRLNGLLASPSFASWMDGRPLDLDSLIRDADGRPAASIIYLAHLSEAERQFVVTLILSRLIAWMRRQPGTSDLRLLVYMDEMFGFAPPTAQPPSKKPILTIFKQGRAHGVGMVVSTQNPVDLDYKVISNAGTWMLGRLQTERDKARVLEGLRSADGGVDVAAIGDLLSGLRKREFVLRTTRSAEPLVFTTRWAMSYLRGGLTREEIGKLTAEHSPEAMPAPDGAGRTPGEAGGTVPRQAAVGSADDSPVADDETPLPPTVPDSVPVYHLDPAAPWATELAAVAGSTRLEPALVARLQLTFDDRYAGVDHTEEWEAVYFPLSERFDAAAGRAVDYDGRDFRDRPPQGARYVLGDAPIANAAFYREAERAVREDAYRRRDVEVLRNPELKLYSRVGETRDAFTARCRNAAHEAADDEVARLRDRYQARIERLRDALARAESRVRELEVDVATRKQQELVAGAGKLISMFLRGRASASGLSGVASRRSMTRRTEERLRSAEERREDQEEEIGEMEAELADDVQEIVRAWEARAESIEAVAIGLEKDDIAVEEVALLWVPR